MLLKSRKAKNSTRGIYLQDSILNNTSFQPGTNFKYIVDLKNKRIEIISSDEKGSNTVSKREMKKFSKPVIDIRDKKVLSAFEGCEYLQVHIYDDKVLVEGFTEVEEVADSLTSKVLNAVEGVKNIFKKQSRVIDITDLLSVKKKASIILSKKQLKKVVGGQLSFDDYGWFISEDSESNNVSDLQSYLEHLAIPLQVVSLFSGAGLFDWGFKKEGFDIKFAIEINKHAVETYRHNLGNHIHCGDINDSMNLIPNSPVMIIGNPCKPFTNSNRSVKRLLEHPDFFLVKRSIEAIRNNSDCSVFVMENVPQILTAHDGQVKHEILEALSEFEITYGVLSAADMGAPQKRDRAIIIGSKIGRIDLPKPVLEPNNYVTVREAFYGLDDSVPNQTDISKSRKETVERMKYVPQGGNVWDIPEHMRPDSKHSVCHRRLSWDEPSITIVNPRKALITHPEENRILSVRECARLFGLTDDFIFKGNLNEMQQQICNAVPIPLSSAIARVVKNAIGMFNLRNRKFAF